MLPPDGAPAAGPAPESLAGQPRGSIFLASDLHLGVPSREESLARERRFVRWLEAIRPRAAELLLVGDVFDFWFEYRHAVPKGYVRLLGALAELADSGLPITVFCGNHDLWYRDYFPQELGVAVRSEPWQREWFGRRYFIAHGDGLGPGDRGYKLLRRVFTSPVLQWGFRHLMHPDWGIGLANYFSGRSRAATRKDDSIDYGEREMLLQFARAHHAAHPAVDAYVFGHRHLCKRQPLAPGSPAEMIYLGDWLRHDSYLEIGPAGCELLRYEG